ncbi:MAG: hypothetical protein ACLSAP_02585 [Oscillospiraceae bacterium]
MSSRRNKIVIFAAVLLLVSAVSAPSVYFSIREALLLAGAYNRTTVPVVIDPEAEEMYMVRAVRDAYYLGVGAPKIEESGLREEWARLSDGKNGFPKLPAGTPSDGGEMTLQALEGMALSAQQLVWTTEDGQFGAVVHTEAKTGKILYMDIQSYGKLLLDSGDVNRKHDTGAARAFCAYLGLDVLDDWSEQDGILVSQKASLKIVCQRTPEAFSLYVAPLESRWASESLWSVSEVREEPGLSPGA